MPLVEKTGVFFSQKCGMVDFFRQRRIVDGQEGSDLFIYTKEEPHGRDRRGVCG